MRRACRLPVCRQASWSFALWLCSALALAAPGADFFVATDGSDRNDGSAAHPWRTVQHAADVLTPGQRVFVHAGTYHEAVLVQRGGDLQHGPIEFRNYPGEQPVLDGTGVPCCGGTIKALFDLESVGDVTVAGFEVRNFVSDAVNDEPTGILVRGSGARIRLLGNSVHDIATRRERDGNAHGIGLYGSGIAPLSQVEIGGNTLYRVRTGHSESMTLDGNLQDFDVHDNAVHDNDNIGIDAAGYYGVGPPGHDHTRHGRIHGNVVYLISSRNNPAYGGYLGADGIYCDGCEDVIIEDNDVWQCDINVEAASENAGHSSQDVIIRDNVLRDPFLVDVSIGGYASTVGGSDGIQILNNTLYNADANRGNDVQLQYAITRSRFENNIVYSNAGGGGALYGFTPLPTGAVVMDYNLYYSVAGARAAVWVWQGITYTGWHRYQLAAGEAHSQFANPQFTDASANEFTLAPGSPALDAGVIRPAIGRLDFAGNPRTHRGTIDLGAYEQTSEANR